MSFFPLTVQAQPFYLNGSGAVIGATSLTLKSFKQIDGTADITMAMFGTKGWGTLEPGNSTLEEQVSFTGVTQNSDGTATLTGVKSVGFVTPFTETSGLSKTHAGSTSFVVSNDAGFYAQIKDYIDTAISAGAVPATTTVNGIGHVSVAPVDAANPIFVGDNDPRVPNTNTTAALVGLSGTAPSATNLFVDSRALTGMISPFAGRTAPTGFLLCDGTAVSRSTYASLLAVIAPSGTFTVTIATPAVFTKASHGLVAGDKISLTTTGALPTGLSTNTDYYVISTGLTSGAFEVALSPAGAAVNTSGSQSGVHTVYATAWGKGDGSTTFNVPDLRAKMPLGLAATAPTITLVFEGAQRSSNAITILNTVFPSQGQKVQLSTTGALPTGLSAATDYWIIRVSTTSISFATTQANANAGTAIVLSADGSGVNTITFTDSTHTVLGRQGGEETHGMSKGESATHTHTISAPAGNYSNTGTGSSGTASANLGFDNTGLALPTGSVGSDSVHNNMSPFAVVNYMIKT